jgi:hypothetical protein
LADGGVENMVNARKFIEALFIVCLVSFLFFSPVLAHERPLDRYGPYNGTKDEYGHDIVVIQRFCAECGAPLPLNTSQFVSYCDNCAHKYDGLLWVLLIIASLLFFACIISTLLFR